MFSSFGPNRGRKAVDKEVSPAAGRKADLLSRIAEAGRVQLVYNARRKLRNYSVEFSRWFEREQRRGVAS